WTRTTSRSGASRDRKPPARARRLLRARVDGVRHAAARGHAEPDRVRPARVRRLRALDADPGLDHASVPELKPLAKAALLWAPVLAWMTLLSYLPSRSDIGPAARIPDWITHGTAYLVLGLLLGRAVAGGAGRRLSTAGAFAVVGLCTLYGISDEFHQSFVP